MRTPFAELELPEGDRAGPIERRPNPIAPRAVAEVVRRLDPAARSWVSFTGGEPLEQVDFLIALAPLLAPRSIHLETAGVNAPEMERLRPFVTHVAMDLKLDSVAKEGDRRGDHRAFLAACRGVDRSAKAILGATTDLAELESLCALVGAEDRLIPVILQPETPASGGFPELPRMLLDQAYAAAARHVDDVRVIPQTHKFLRLP